MSAAAEPVVQKPLAAEPLAGNCFVAAYPPFSAWSASQASSIANALASLAPDSTVPWGLYLHIPFCEKRCDYCYYLSLSGTARRDIERYVEQLAAEADLYARLPRFVGRGPRFVYFGGGTPSLLSADFLSSLLGRLAARLDWSACEEITFECSPKSISREKLAVLKAIGVNRISLGVQQLDDSVLRQSGRVHLVADVLRAAGDIQEFDFAEFNVDLIAGLRGQSDASFLAGVERTIDLRPHCVTIYQLEVPANTPLFRALADDHVVGELADWETKRQRVGAAFALLQRRGYTVRNAYSAATGERHRRFVYMEDQYRGADLVGLGLSSFSYVAGTHFQNTTRMHAYCEAVGSGRFPVARGYALSPEEQCVRELVLQFKLGHINRGYFRHKFATDPVERFALALSELAAGGYLTWDEEAIRLTRDGLVRVDRLLPMFYLRPHQGNSYW